MVVAATKTNLDHRRKIIRGGSLNPNASSAARYRRALEALIRKMTDTYEREIKKLYARPIAKEYFAQDESISSQAKILLTELSKRFEDLFNFKAKGLAESMLNDASATSASSLKTSLKELSGGLTLKTDILTGELKDVLKASIQENVGLIKSIPAQYHKQAEGAVYRSITSAQGQKDLIPFLRKYKGMTERRARNISDDQYRKAYTAINKGRLQKLGFRRFEWRHYLGSAEPRKLHMRLNGQVFRFDNPPVIDDTTGERGFPAQLPNCRCTMAAVVDFSDRDE
jgi:SPP1 gp7 family putative phage head morphogenesis protein